MKGSNGFNTNTWIGGALLILSLGIAAVGIVISLRTGSERPLMIASIPAAVLVVAGGSIVYRSMLPGESRLLLPGGEKTITAILPVLDDFERALADTHTDDPAAIKEGMDLIFKKFVKTLEGLGVKKIDTDDKDFDVDYHEAIAMVPGMGDDKKGKVIDCVQTGYMLNDKVIRHAKVAVGQ